MDSNFDKYMKSDLLKYSGRWIIEKFPGLYVPYSCIKGLQPTEKNTNLEGENKLLEVRA